MTERTLQAVTWSGDYALEEHGVLRIQIGPLFAAIQRLANEWQIRYRRESAYTELDDIDTWEIRMDDEMPDDWPHVERFAFQKTAPRISLTPKLADRCVITRPITPFNLFSGQEVTLFVSSPLWLEIVVGSPPTSLMEIPCYRPSDTWFGPSTLEGELCYAARTRCRLDLSEVPVRPHRAITPVKIVNRATSVLTLERLNLPVVNLALYRTDDGMFWTPSVTLTRAVDGDMAAMQVGSGASGFAKNAVKIGGPRQRAGKGALIRAFNALFS